MPFYRLAGIPVHVNFGRRKNVPAPCVARIGLDGREVRCAAISAYLCDWELSDGSTCDAPLCQSHANAVGPNRHYCPRHHAQHRAQQPELPLFGAVEATAEAPDLAAARAAMAEYEAAYAEGGELDYPHWADAVIRAHEQEVQRNET